MALYDLAFGLRMRGSGIAGTRHHGGNVPS